MPQLSTQFTDIPLKNPILVGASKITAHLETLQQCEAAGAAGVVIHSLFEEQIMIERLNARKEKPFHSSSKTKVTELYPKGLHGSVSGHLDFIKEVKSSLSIPVIASLNATHGDVWAEFSKAIQDAGADGLEMNLYHNPDSPAVTPEEVEDEMVAHVEQVCESVEIPVMVKLSLFHSNIPRIVTRMNKAGAKGFILFNKMFASDIDTEHLKHTQSPNLSQQGDARLSNRFIGMLYKKVRADFCCNTGVFDAQDIIKAILCGAETVQIVSTLYKHRIHNIVTLLSELESWMQRKGFENLDDFRGKLSEARCADKFIYRRAQYLDALIHSETYKE